MERPTPEPRTSPPRSIASFLVPALGLACVAVPHVSPALALTAGVALALSTGNPYAPATRALARRLLPLSVVALGGAMDLRVVAHVGARGVGYTFVSIAACLALGALLARAARVEARTAALISVGTAICGGSAIAAVAPVVGADEHETSIALGAVFLLNSAALLVFPLVGHAAGLAEPAFGLWAALGIHDTSSVVGATLAYGPQALAVGTTVKLARALWIVPVTLAIAIVARRARGGGAATSARPPWFILGFVAVAALATFLPVLRPAGLLAAEAGRRALVLTLFLVGLGLSRQALRSVGAGALAMAVALWIAVGTATLAAVRGGLVHL
ncbi:YeiH family protein [Anaeromyxobacter sp. PSR-1]|uniref:YeiH family protein n=1 Tax=unclassified Anaeromyxobacter TaxID=2620896 RepID=UPI000750F61D|nr:putative sulfate exporter family transporter [Anaeromyxobacter sp. PSR-1]